MHQHLMASGGFRHPAHLARLINTPLLTTLENAYGWLVALASRSDFQVAELRGELVEPMRHRAGAPAGKRASGWSNRPYPLTDGIATIAIGGSLANKWGSRFCGTTGYDWITEAVQAAIADPEVRGIMLDVDSPGGEVAGCFDCADVIYRACEAKPVWASLSEMALSAGYALASQAERIIVPRTGTTGSIGVVCMHMDHSRMFDKAGVTVTLIHAGAHKVDGNPYEELPEEVRAELAASCERSRLLFAETVARSRGLSVEDVLATEARCYDGEDGLDVGLADEVLSPAEAMAAFREHLSGSDNGGRSSAASAASSANSERSKTMAGNSRGTQARTPQRGRRAEDQKPEDQVEGEEKPEDETEGDDKPEDGCEGEEKPEDDAEGEDKPEDEAEGEDKPEEGAEGEEEPKDPKEARGYRKGRAAEAKRWSSVMNSPHAKGRTATAITLLGNAKLSAKEVKSLLAGMPKSGGGSLSEAMSNVSNVPGATGGGTGGGGKMPDAASRIVSNYRKATGNPVRRGQ